MKKLVSVAAFSAALAACSGYVDKYEEGVNDYEATYCYAALGGGVECYREPLHGDERRLVNYYGKHPSRYDAPEPAEKMTAIAPEKVNSWVKDPEPVVRAMPHGDTADRPWIASGYRDPSMSQASPEATQAFLRRAHEHLTKSIEGRSKNRLEQLQRQATGAAADSADSEGGNPPLR